MKSVQELREGIEHIPDVFLDLQPDDAERGRSDGVRTIWHPHTSGLCTIDLGELDPVDKPETIPDIEELFEFRAPIDETLVTEVMGGGLGNDLRRALQLKGVDALGWYVPFHARAAQWGIYIKASSLLFMAVDVLEDLPTDLWTKIQIGLRVIHQHELFHFATEYMSAQMEGLISKPCFKPSRRLKGNSLGYHVLEEEMANGHMLRSSRCGPSSLRVAGKIGALHKFVKLQGPGYCDAKRVFDADRFADGCRRLALDYLSCMPDYNMHHLGAVNLPELYPFAPKIDWRYCLLMIVADTHVLSLPSIDISLFDKISALAETETFIRTLRNLPSALQRKWQKTKLLIAQNLHLPGLDFKLWSRNGEIGKVFSVRVDRSYRAHLEYGADSRTWTATHIGTHKQMGHG